jgi:hypothetical protein
MKQHDHITPPTSSSSLSLPPITKKQYTIIQLLYRHRFLNRIQIQALCNHKDKRQILRWLKDLREKEYVTWRYDHTNLLTKTKPAIYSLSLNGIRSLRTRDLYPNKELRKYYREADRSRSFVEDCLFASECSVMLHASHDDHLRYTYETAADYSDPDRSSYFLSNIKPALYFIKHQNATTTEYILEIFSSTTPSYQLRKRMRDYIAFLSGTDWDDWDVSHPVLLIACLNTANLLHTKRYLRKLLERISDGEYRVPIRLTLRDKIKTDGITQSIWEEV